jgi:hypothetical protein
MKGSRIFENISQMKKYPGKVSFDGLITLHSGYTPLKNSIRPADEFSSKLPVTDLYGAPRRGADSNLHWYKSICYRGINGIGRIEYIDCNRQPQHGYGIWIWFSS